MSRRSDKLDQIITPRVTAYGSISKKYCGNCTPEAAKRGIRASMHPNKTAPNIARSNLHWEKITSAIIIQPRPPEIPSTQIFETPTVKYPPANPIRNPLAKIAAQRTNVTSTPAASAASGFSPTARNFSPLLVLFRK